MTNISSDSRELPPFDSITFPSDRLTFGVLRHRFRERFDTRNSSGAYGEFFLPAVPDCDWRVIRHLYDIQSMLTDERELVEMEAAVAGGYVPDAGWLEERDLAVAQLAALYCNFGVASTAEEAHLFVERVRQIGREIATGNR